MKRLILLIAIFCTVLSAKAQVGLGGGASSVVGKISGTVIDSVTKKPLDYATVSLSRSGGKAILNGVVTDEKGKFSINNIAVGSYKLVISFIGYPSKTIDPVTTTREKPDANLGTVILAPNSKTLNAVVIEGQASVIENKIDKIVFNAEKDVTSTGGNATDVLRKVPLVSVDINGNVSLRGDQNVRVLINGKPSGALSSSLADVLRTIPADQIKNVEVITSPSAKYDAEGSGGIINIITKTKNVSGFSGSISGGLGTVQNNGNVNLNYKQNRFSLTGNVGTNYAWPQTSTVEFMRNSTVNNIATSNSQNSSAKTKRFGTLGTVTAGYDVNDFNSFTSTLRVNGGGFETDGSAIAANTVGTLTRNYNSTNFNKAAFTGFDWSADYTHKFKKQGEELTLAGQWSHSKIASDYTSEYFNIDFPNQKGSNDGINDEYTAQLDYALPISSKVKLEAGGKSIFRKINSNFDVFNQVNNQGPYLLTDSASSKYDYSQDVYAGYTVMSFTLPKSFGLQVGARVENTRISGEPNNPGQVSLEPFGQNYTTFVPSFVLSKTIKNTQTYKLSYNKRIQRPSLQFLNPFINKANNQNQSQGNPELAPEVSQTVELGYSTFFRSSMINLSVYYKNTEGLIEGIVTPIQDPDLVSPTNPNGSTSRTIFNNVARNNALGASFFGSINPIKPLTLRGNVNVYTYNPTIYAEYASLQKDPETSVQYNIFMSGSLALKKGFSAEMFGVFNSPRRTIQGENPAFNLFGLGLKKELIAKKLTVGVNAMSPFQKYLKLDQNISANNISQVQKIRYPIQSFGVNLSYNFGKMNFNQQKKKGVNNDDLMQGGDQGGMGGGQGPRQ